MEDGNNTGEDMTLCVNNALGVKYKLIEDEYIDNDDIYIESPIVGRLKQLSFEERKLIILYAELGSVRKVAKLYPDHYTTISRKINKIKNKFKHLSICKK